MIVHVVIVDGKETAREPDKDIAMTRFVEATKSDFTDRVELVRVVAFATRGVNIVRNYRERSAKPTTARRPRKVKAEAAS